MSSEGDRTMKTSRASCIRVVPITLLATIASTGCIADSDAPSVEDVGLHELAPPPPPVMPPPVPHGTAWALVDASGGVHPVRHYNSTGAPIIVDYLGVGRYRVRIEGISSDEGNV